MNDYMIRILQQYIGQKFKIIPIIKNIEISLLVFAIRARTRTMLRLPPEFFKQPLNKMLTELHCKCASNVRPMKPTAFLFRKTTEEISI